MCRVLSVVGNRIDGVMISVLALSVVDRGFIDGVMISVLALSVVDRGFDHNRVKRKTMQLVCVASPLSTQY